MLGFVPQPVVALILLFPSKPRDDKTRRVEVADHHLSSKVYYLTQLQVILTMLVAPLQCFTAS